MDSCRRRIRDPDRCRCTGSLRRVQSGPACAVRAGTVRGSRSLTGSLPPPRTLHLTVTYGCNAAIRFRWVERSGSCPYDFNRAALVRLTDSALPQPSLVATAWRPYMVRIRVAAWAAIALASISTGRAQDVIDPEPSEIPAVDCDENRVSPELRQVCKGIGDSVREVMSRPYEGRASASAPIRSLRSFRRPLSTELTAYGLSEQPDRRFPLAPAPDRGVGVRVKAAERRSRSRPRWWSPATRPPIPSLNWELKAESGATAVQSGAYLGGAAAGAYQPTGASENVSVFAGVRQIVRPWRQHHRSGSEITPRLSVADASAASLAIEPRLTTSTEFERIGNTNFQASLNADLGYNLLPWMAIRRLMAGFASRSGRNKPREACRLLHSACFANEGGTGHAISVAEATRTPVWRWLATVLISQRLRCHAHSVCALPDELGRVRARRRFIRHGCRRGKRNSANRSTTSCITGLVNPYL